MQPARRLLTYEDLLQLPEGERGEIVRGSLMVAPAPLPRHGRIQRAIGARIGTPFDDDDGSGGPGGWWIIPEVEIRFDAHEIFRADLAGWLRPRLPDPWDQRPIDVVPDWVCEILSPSNAAHDRVTKKQAYASAGVPFYWIVDPQEHTLEAFALRDGRWVDVGAFDRTATARIQPFDAIELSVGRVFPPNGG